MSLTVAFHGSSGKPRLPGGGEGMMTSSEDVSLVVADQKLDHIVNTF